MIVLIPCDKNEWYSLVPCLQQSLVYLVVRWICRILTINAENSCIPLVRRTSPPMSLSWQVCCTTPILVLLCIALLAAVLVGEVADCLGSFLFPSDSVYNVTASTGHSYQSFFGDFTLLLEENGKRFLNSVK